MRGGKTDSQVQERRGRPGASAMAALGSFDWIASAQLSESPEDSLALAAAWLWFRLMPF